MPRQYLHPNDVRKLNSLAAEVARLRAIVESLAGGGLPPVTKKTKLDDLPDIFKVRLTQTGGSAGTSSTQCSFTYSVFLWSDTGKTEAVATAVAVLGNGGRAEFGIRNAATYGLAIRDTDDAIKLLWTDESDDTAAGCV